ncbi:hypothetical protein EON64_03490 [archaeon]|nr:MAG: hypothetical protein EON64_03490 [archaeon]
MESIENKIEDAVKNAGDTDVIDGYFTKAKYQISIGDFAAADASFDVILSKPKTVTGKKIDAYMEKAKVGLFTLDTTKLNASINEAKKLNETGGDWDRRNRLKIYEAFYLLHTREVKEAAKLLLDCVATFTCTELCTYTQFMFYVLVTSIITLDRNYLRKKVIKDPNVITLIRELPNAQKLVQSIYNCNYAAFFQAIVPIHDELQENRFLAPLSTYLVREYRVLAYSQFLEAYKSVMLSSMAASFGITVTLLDSELSRFIAAGRLNAKIDKVGDIVETRRPDKKNAQYHEIIKKGDVLLNHIQKLVRAIDV